MKNFNYQQTQLEEDLRKAGWTWRRYMSLDDTKYPVYEHPSLVETHKGKPYCRKQVKSPFEAFKMYTPHVPSLEICKLNSIYHLGRLAHLLPLQSGKKAWSDFDLESIAGWEKHLYYKQNLKWEHDQLHGLYTFNTALNHNLTLNAINKSIALETALLMLWVCRKETVELLNDAIERKIKDFRICGEYDQPGESFVKEHSEIDILISIWDESDRWQKPGIIGFAQKMGINLEKAFMDVIKNEPNCF